MTRYFVPLIALALVAQPSPRAAAGRAMTLDDLITAVRVSDPQLSPDGRTVLYVRTTTDGKTGKRNADIYAVAADGSGGHELKGTIRQRPGLTEVELRCLSDKRPGLGDIADTGEVFQPHRFIGEQARSQAG